MSFLKIPYRRYNNLEYLNESAQFDSLLKKYEKKNSIKDPDSTNKSIRNVERALNFKFPVELRDYCLNYDYKFGYLLYLPRAMLANTKEARKHYKEFPKGYIIIDGGLMTDGGRGSILMNSSGHMLEWFHMPHKLNPSFNSLYDLVYEALANKHFNDYPPH